MKRIAVVSILSLIFVSFTSFKTKEELWLRGLFENVKSNDLNKFKQMCITEQEFALLITNSTWSPEKKESMKKRMTQTFLDQKTKEFFNSITSKVNDNKILWSKTVIDSINYKVRQIEGMEEMTFKIYLSQDKRKYQLTGDKCLKTPVGWKLSSGADLIVKPSVK